MRFQAGLQIILLVTAGIIVFSVIKPKFESISLEQTEVVSYRTALENLGQYNQKLQSLMNEADALSAYDRSVLFRYLPEEVDSPAVARDISNIVTQNRLLLLDIIAQDPEPILTDTPVMDDGTGMDPYAAEQSVIAEEGQILPGTLVSHTFEVEVVGTYEQIKSMLKDLERNAYPLRVIEFTFNLEEAEEEGSNLVQYSLLLETYSLASS